MLISLLVLLLFSNAVNLRRDKSILFFRIVIIGLLLTSFLAYANLYLRPLENGIVIYGGLFNVSTFTQSCNVFIFLISAVILTLTAFYFREIKTSFLLCNTLLKTLTVKLESTVISIRTLLLLFIYMPEQWFSIVSILTYLIFNKHEI